jgi:hypothetical protein
VVPVASVAEARQLAAETAAALDATMTRAASFSDEDLHRGVNDEWSTVESLRHIVMVIDVWLSKTILGETDPFHPIGLPPSFIGTSIPGSSIDPNARPSFDEASEVLRGRLEVVHAYAAKVTDDDLERPVEAHAKTVGGALNVLFTELKAHNYFVNRDLDTIGQS